MVGAVKKLWPLAFLAALPLLLAGCGGVDPNAATQFRPVDDEEPAAVKAGASKSGGEARLPAAVDELPAEPRTASTKATGAPKSNGATKPAVGSTAKGASGRPPAATEDKAASNDPALAGPTAAKVRRMRTLLRSLGGNLEGETQEAKMQYLMDLLQQTMTTAGEVMAEEKAPPEARDEALLARFQVASMMMQAGPEGEAKEILAQASADLSKAHDTRYATLGRVQLFKLHVVEVLKLQPADANDVLTALDTLLEEGGSVDVITSEVMPLVSQLEQFGYAKEGVAAIAKIGDHFANSKDKHEALIGKQLQVSGLVGKLRSGQGDAAEVGEQLVAKAREIIEASAADRGGINLLFQLAYNQEGDHPEVAGKLYDLIEEKYAENEDAKVADKAKELAASGRQRMSLVGKPLEVTGVLVDGDPFDWSKYQGKVVLVHFWALSSEPSLQDISNKDRLHRKYARRGLNIIGVNLDLNVGKVQELFEGQQLAWPTVTGENPSQRGFKHPAAQACGVIAEALPFTVLIGSDGKIAAAGLQGPPLDEAIVKLLAANDKQPEGKQPEEKPAGQPKEDEGETDVPNKPDEESK